MKFYFLYHTFASSFKLSQNDQILMTVETRDTVFIGKKPLMAYVTSALIQLANLPSVNIKARGMSIGRAVDVAQIIARKTETAGYAIGDIKIGSESLESQDGKTRNVSTIEIEIKRT
jgi:DNA-binding protein